MFSFRRTQFRAVLFSLVIADALSHRLLPWQTSSPNTLLPNHCYEASDVDEASDAVEMPLPSAIANSHWCQETTYVLRQLIDNDLQQLAIIELQSQASAIGQAASLQGAAAILMVLPLFIQCLAYANSAVFIELIASTAVLSELSPIAPERRTAILAFYQGAAALLDGNRDGAAALCTDSNIQTVNPPQPSLEQIVALALKHVLGAEGDFTLTIGQSLKIAPPIPGLPILSSLLSACWVGHQGIPTRWSQPLITPSPRLRCWLQQRWHIDDTASLYKWSEGLSNLWLGRYPSASQMDQRWCYPAVQPVIKPAS